MVSVTTCMTVVEEEEVEIDRSVRVEMGEEEMETVAWTMSASVPVAVVTAEASEGTGGLVVEILLTLLLAVEGHTPHVGSSDLLTVNVLNSGA